MSYKEAIMPRKKFGSEPAAPTNNALAERLAQELKVGHESGQPLVYEHEIRPERLRVTVIWDEWDRVPMEERVSVISRADELAEGAGSRNRIALASGLTVPEATAAGMLPFQVGTALRKDDPVTFEECWQAMVEEGASTMFGPRILQLRFATLEEAEACRQRLIKRLPKSDDVWLVTREVAVQDAVADQETAEVKL